MQKRTFFIIVATLAVILAIVVALASRAQQSENKSMTEETTTPIPKKVGKIGRSYTQFPGVLPEGERVNKQARIVTEKGEIIFEIFGEEVPTTASNFITLASDKFYDDLTFHRREEGFVIQGGDPNGTGTGGPGYKFEDEPVRRPYNRGIVAMANSGPNTNGSQFFIMLADYGLPPLYTIFGQVTEGIEVVDAIMVNDVMSAVTIEDIPTE
jgi:cyclophilin family peptidyl-prolyl cis-trans isomerase